MKASPTKPWQGTCHSFVYSFICSLLLASGLAAANTIPTNLFFGSAGFHDAQLSPDGKHLAVILDKDDQRVAAVLNRKTLKMTSLLWVEDDHHVTSVRWANNERFLASLSQESVIWGDADVNTGDLYAQNYDGTRNKMIFGYRGVERTYGHHEILHTVPDDPKHIVIKVAPWGATWGSLTEAHRLNVNTGELKKIARGKVRDGHFLTDNQGNVQLNYGIDKNDNPVIYQRAGATWEPVTVLDPDIGDIDPLGFIGSSNRVYIRGSRSGQPEGLYILDLDTGKTETLLEPEVANLRSFETAGKEDRIIVAYSMPGREKVHYVEPGDPHARLNRALYSAFPDQAIELLSSTDDESLITLKVSSDTNPGDFYLFDTQAMQATFLFSAFQDIARGQLRPMEPIHFQARDGLELHGYYTAPGAGPQPTVVLVHGGPHGIRDYWSYNEEVQFLVNRGYAVLQVNYRGSDGYGPRFRKQGYGQWWGKIQDDIIDAVHWAINSGKADKDRICIYGGSFGGYSALMAPIRAPGLFKCAIGYVGVYDLTLMRERGDITDKLWAEDYLQKVIGSDPQTLRDNSPVHLASQLTVPVFIAHGEMDERAPVEHAHRLRAALEQHKKPYEWMLLKGERHGFRAIENKVTFYDSMRAFLDKHIGGASTGSKDH